MANSLLKMVSLPASSDSKRLTHVLQGIKEASSADHVGDPVVAIGRQTHLIKGGLMPACTNRTLAYLPRNFLLLRLRAP